MSFVQGLGLEYARQLAASGCRCLVLTSRRGYLPPETLQGFAAAGVTVYAVATDSGDAAQAVQVLAWAREHLPAVQHYAHAAGVSGFSLLGDMRDAELWQVARPKVGSCLFCPLLSSPCAGCCAARMAPARC